MLAKKILPLLIASAFTLAPSAVEASGTAGSPVTHPSVIAAAREEGKLVIYSTTDTKLAAPLIRDFKARYPGLEIEYNDMNSTELYSRFVFETAAGGKTADFLWSSSMDLQMKLVHEGFALAYRSPEAAAIPAWANYRDMAFGTTFEPAVFVYNKRLLRAAEVPRSHAELAALVSAQPERYRHKVITYDIEKSGVGFLLATHDELQNRRFWAFAEAMGNAGVRLQSSTGIMMERIGSGEQLIGYNILGSYAHARAKVDPSIGYVLPNDYTLVLSRVAMINKDARHPNAARLWLDFLLSRRGQALIGNEAQLFSIRADVAGETSAATLTRTHGAVLTPIPVAPSILSSLDPKPRLVFLRKINAATRKKNK